MLQNNANIQKENLIKNWNYTYESSIFAKIKSIFFRLVKVNAYPLTLNIYCPYVPPPLKNGSVLKPSCRPILLSA